MTAWRYGPGYGPERRHDRRFVPFECDPLVIRQTAAFLRMLGFRRTRNIACGLVDLSVGGARFVVREKLALGIRVDVTIHVKLFADVIRVSGTVSWCGDVRTNQGNFTVGVSFGDLSPAVGRKISAFRDYLDSPAFRQKERNRRSAGLQRRAVGRDR